MNSKKSIVLLLLICISTAMVYSGCSNSPSTSTATPTPSPSTSTVKCKWAGVRSSIYGINGFYSKFPSPSIWATAMNHMASHWTGSTPTAIWLVGVVNSSGGTTLEFDKPGNNTYDSKIKFDSDGVNHKACLTYFDTHGIKVFLQLEPGLASVPDQINAVLRKFGKHSCVTGLAIDVEWYKNYQTNSTTLYSVSDSDARAWETLVRKYNPNFRLLLKHFDPDYLPQNYKGQIVFCCDDERNGNMTQFLKEHKRMAKFAYPNPIIYQIGYPSDKTWWGSYSDAPKTLGDALIKQTPDNQECGVLWVDFSFNQLPPLRRHCDRK